VREDLLEEVRSTAHRVLATWQSHFAAANVPERLVHKVETHVANSKLGQA